MDSSAPTGGRRVKQLRTAVHGVRTTGLTAGDQPGDADLLELVSEPYTGVEETHTRLGDLLAAYEERDDRRAVFLAIYWRMTAEVARGIRNGDFADPDWVGDYLVAFANLYRRAVRDYERGNVAALPDPWHVAFRATERGDSLVVQDAALGVNAHINYDLALALAAAGVGPDRPTKYEDHTAVIDVIADLVDEAQQTLVARDADGLAAVDDSLGQLDEWLAVATINECRESAWRTAVAMNSRFRVRRRFAHWWNAVTSKGAAYLIRSSQASDAVHETLADMEQSAES